MWEVIMFVYSTICGHLMASIGGREFHEPCVSPGSMGRRAPPTPAPLVPQQGLPEAPSVSPAPPDRTA